MIIMSDFAKEENTSFARSEQNGTDHNNGNEDRLPTPLLCQVEDKGDFELFTNDAGKADKKDEFSYVRIRCSDEKIFLVPFHLACEMRTIKNMLTGPGRYQEAESVVFVNHSS
eukprot:Nk52_evm17s2578 gene=Nk52_evmTU17s2578